MSPNSALPRSLAHFIGRRLAAGLLGGLSAALLLSLLDWWLMLPQGGRGLNGESAAVLCYAFLLLGTILGCAGVGLSLLAAAGGGARAYRSHARIIFALCLAGGGALLIRFGWMPHWSRTGVGRPGISGPWIIVLLTALALGSALLPAAVHRLLRRDGRGSGPGKPGRSTVAAALCLVLLLAGAAAGWSLAGTGRDASGSSSTAPVVAAVNRADAGSDGDRPDGPPVVVLLLDTLRWDALSCYGSGDNLTPHLDRFCRQSVQFEVARAQASWTKPSIATLLTSTTPLQHGARGRSDRIRASVTSAAQVFRRAGYRTGAVVANGNLSPAFGFARGFQHYHYLRPLFALGARGRALGLGSYRLASAAWQRLARGRRDHRYFKRDAAEVNQAVLEWLDGPAVSGLRGIFLFVNYVDPHDPYFRHPYDGWALGAVDGKVPSPRVRDEMAALYDGEVAFLDHHLGRLFAHLRRLGLYDRSVIVITSDHGEEFMDHGGWWHGLTLYEEQLRVPLLVRLPGGQGGGRRAAGAAGLIDVAPGLLELAGLEARRPGSMIGLSLTRWLPGESPGGEDGPRFFHADEVLDGNVLSSLTEGRWKYVRANADNPRGLPREALYDLQRDPGERTNLADANPRLAATMSDRLDHLQANGPDAKEMTPEAALDEETAEHLRALGYLQ